MARYGQAFQSKTVGRLQPPESATAAARLEAVITTAAMNETGKSGWCREHGVYMAELERWVACATAALGDPARAAAGARAKPQDGLRIRALERDLWHKDRALSETLSLLVLSKKVAAIFNTGEAE